MNPIAVWLDQTGQIVARLFDCFTAYKAPFSTDLMHCPHLVQLHGSKLAAVDFIEREYPDAVQVMP